MKKEAGAVLVVSVLLILGLGMFALRYSPSENNLIGNVIVSSSGSECEDTDNNIPASGLGAEQEGTDSIWVKGGVKTRTRSTARWLAVEYDSCRGSTLRELYCDRNARKISEDVICSYGCTDGKCNRPPCTDSDSADYTVQGIATGLRSITEQLVLGIPPKSQVNTYSDSCTSASILKEYTCGRTGLVVENSIRCSRLGARYKCNSGRCIPSSLPPETSCNGLDDDSNGIIDEGCDDDNDGWCDSNMSFENTTRVTIPSAYGRVSSTCSSGRTVSNSNCCHKITSPVLSWCGARNVGDCNDLNAVIYPGAQDRCDGINNNCGTYSELCYYDSSYSLILDSSCDNDNDGYCRIGAIPVNGSRACRNGITDCADWNPMMYPGAVEDCFRGSTSANPGYDDNCNGLIDEGCSPYSCESIEPNGSVSYSFRFTAANGQVIVRDFRDSCDNRANSITRGSCPSGVINFANNTFPVNITTSCPAGTICLNDTVTTSAVCR